MNTAPLVLHLGRDLPLLNARSAVLGSAGFTVVRTFTVREALSLFDSGDFDMVVLCHSVTPEEREQVTRFVHSRSRTVPVIVVQPLRDSDGLGDSPLGSADILISADPTVFLAQVTSLERKPHSAAKA